MKRIADRRELLLHTSAAGLGCLDRVLPAAVARAAEPGGNGMLRAGAASVDITPVKFPVLVSGGFLSRSTSKINERLCGGVSSQAPRARSRRTWCRCTRP